MIRSIIVRWLSFWYEDASTDPRPKAMTLFRKDHKMARMIPQIFANA